MFEDFVITIVNDYAFGQIDGLLLERTQSDKAALVNALERETRGLLEELSVSAARDTWGIGSGSLAVVDGAPAGDVITVGAGQAKGFEINMSIVAAATQTGGLNAGGAATIVLSINLEDETIEVTAGGVVALSIVDGDFLFPEGDAADGGAVRKLTGVRSWIPAPGDSIGSLFGVDRTTYPERLAGFRLDGTGLASKEVAIKALVAKIRSGLTRAKPTQIWLHPNDLDSLTTELGAKRHYEKIDVPNADISFDAVAFHGPGGVLHAIDDAWLEEGVAYAIDPTSWCWSTLGEAPRIITHDGQRVLRVANDDAIELRGVIRQQLFCDAPGFNGAVLLPT